MSVRILANDDDAVFYCSTSMWAFGPVFTEDAGHDATERAESFLRWLATTATWPTYEKEPIQSGRRDPRELTDSSLAQAYSDWQAQEAEQWRVEEQAIFPEEASS